jgi:hypothetical protein
LGRCQKVNKENKQFHIQHSPYRMCSKARACVTTSSKYKRNISPTIHQSLLQLPFYFLLIY